MKDSYTVGTSEIDKLKLNKFEKHVQKLEKKCYLRLKI